MKEIKTPLVANINRSNGDVEISIAKKYSETEESMYKSYMRAMMNEVGEGGLTEKQKKLPAALQKAILEKIKKDA